MAAPRTPLQTMGWTTRGLEWERRQLLCFGLYLTWFLYWATLVYMGLRVLQPKWVVWGALYGLPFFIKVFVGPGSEFEDWLDRWQFLAFIVSLGHAWMARGEFLARLDNMESESEEVMAEASAQAEPEASSVSEPAPASAGSPVVEFFSNAPEARSGEPARPIDYAEKAPAARTVDAGPDVGGEATAGPRAATAKPGKPGGRVVDV